MCGIWGIVGKKNYKIKDIYKIIEDLFILSESRGKEASGVACLYKEHTICLKKPLAASDIIHLPEYQKILKKYLLSTENKVAIIGHSRLVTNGSEVKEENNQPVSYRTLTTVHNGIIVNADELWEKNTNLQRKSDVDTEVFVKVCESYYRSGISPEEATKKTFEIISGMTSILSVFSDSRKLIAATNNGSLYCWRSKDKGLILFASEKYMFTELQKKNLFAKKMFHRDSIVHLKAWQEVIVNIDTIGVTKVQMPFNRVKETNNKIKIPTQILSKKYSFFDIDTEPIKKIRRCTRCVLPSTMPYIEFDENGVCNYCRTYKKMKYLDRSVMLEITESIKARNKGKENNAVVSFSGGRDSSYGLHYFVREMGLKPIAYNYDWGMVTDLARRNQSRMCAALGVELITVSADIRKKRENIRKNIQAWLKNPDLGMIPLFMAGDKAFFYYANVMKKRFDADCILLASNPFETTYFKSAFCGVKPPILQDYNGSLEVEQLNATSTIKMASYYLKQFISNRKYINSSVLDTAFATASYYIIPHNYFRLFNFIPWDEDEINKVLINEYDWEKATDTESTWRIGDGTAPFYNYIYYLICGFTENDTLRSNQIREGKLQRERALDLVYSDNQPRWESLEWYFKTIGMDMDIVLKRINGMKRLYR